MISPPLSCRLRSISGRTSGSLPVPSRRASQRKNNQITNRPIRISQIVGERSTQDGPPGFGWIQPQSVERSTPKTSAPSPSADSTAPTTSSCGRFSAGASAILRREDEDDRDDHDLAGEHPAPGEVGRAEAADQRPDRDGDRAGRSDEAVGGRAALPGSSGDECDDRRQDQRRTDALEERPADQEDGQARRHRRRQRPAP